jgi:Mg-chelatase subunit ChlD
MMLIWLYPLVLILVPLVLAAAWYRSRRADRAVYVPATHLFPPEVGRRISWKAVARLVGSVLAVTAAAAPVIVLPVSELSPAVLVVVLDNSASMAEADVLGPENQKLKRWDAATNELMKVLQSKANGLDWRVGLVLCADHAELVCPPVQGLANLEPFIRGAGPQQQSGVAGTDLSSGLVLALETAMVCETKNRAILLISDGENNASPPESGKTLQQLGQIAKALEVPCHSLEVTGGANTEEKPTTAFKNLMALGQITGGKTFQARTSSNTQDHLHGILASIDIERNQAGGRYRLPINSMMALVASILFTMCLIAHRNWV